MNSQTKHIAAVARKALESFGSESLPVPIQEVVKKFGLNVVEFDFPNALSGVLKKERMVIGVNKNHPEVRQRFTIAHELGHFLLGHEISQGEDMIDDDFDKPVHKEREANIFASQILIPEKLLKDEVAKNKINLKNLSEMFNVSEQAVTIRLLESNLI